MESFLSGFSFGEGDKRAALAVALIFLVIGGALLAFKGGFRSYATLTDEQQELINWALSQVPSKTPEGIANWVLSHVRHPGVDTQPDTHDPIRALEMIRNGERPDVWCDVIAALWVLLVEAADIGKPLYTIVELPDGWQHALGLMLDPNNRDRFYAFYAVQHGDIKTWSTSADGYTAFPPGSQYEHSLEADLRVRLQELRDEGYKVRHVSPPGSGWWPITWFVVSNNANETEMAGAKIRVEAMETASGWDVKVTLTAPSSSCRNENYDFWVDGEIEDIKYGISLCNGQTETFIYSIEEGDHVVGAAWGCGLYATLALVEGTGGTSAEGTPGSGGYSSSTGGESYGEGGIGYTPPSVSPDEMYLGPWLIGIHPTHDSELYSLGLIEVEQTTYRGRDAMKVKVLATPSDSDYKPYAWIVVKPALYANYTGEGSPIEQALVWSMEFEYELVSGDAFMMGISNSENPWGRCRHVGWFGGTSHPCLGGPRPSLYRIVVEGQVRDIITPGWNCCPKGEASSTGTPLEKAIRLIGEGEQIPSLLGKHRVRLVVDKLKNAVWVQIDDNPPYPYVYSAAEDLYGDNLHGGIAPSSDMRNLLFGMWLKGLHLGQTLEAYLYLDSLRLYAYPSPDIQMIQPTEISVWTDSPIYRLDPSKSSGYAKIFVSASPGTDYLTVYVDDPNHPVEMKADDPKGSLWVGSVRLWHTYRDRPARDLSYGEHTVFVFTHNLSAQTRFRFLAPGENLTDEERAALEGDRAILIETDKDLYQPGEEVTITVWIKNVEPSDVESYSLTVDGPTGEYSLSPVDTWNTTIKYRFRETSENGTYTIHAEAVVKKWMGLGTDTLTADAQFCVGECSGGGVLGDFGDVLGDLTEPNEDVYNWLVDHGVPESLANILAMPITWIAFGIFLFLLLAGGGSKKIKIETGKFSYIRGVARAARPPAFYFARPGAGRGPACGPPNAPSWGDVI